MPSFGEIDRHNRRFLRQRGRLKMFSAAEATVVIGTRSGLHQVCQLGFAADGSFRCAWPYLAVGAGVVAEVSFPAPSGDSVTFSLSERGRFTSQLVKFSHHTSGLALFSLTGKVRSDVRRPSFPLNGPIGRLFEMHVFFPAAFKRLELLKSRRLYLTFIADLPDSTAFLIRGEWRKKQEAVDGAAGSGDVGPMPRFRHRRTGEEGIMFFFAPPLSSPLTAHHVCVIARPYPLPSGAGEPGLVFMGGYDHHEAPPGPRVDLPAIKGGLAAMYPVRGGADVRDRLGSIDLDLGAA